jgi:hypothetical protein
MLQSKDATNAVTPLTMHHMDLPFGGFSCLLPQRIIIAKPPPNGHTCTCTQNTDFEMNKPDIP